MLLSAPVCAHAQTQWTLQPVPDAWRSMPRNELAPIDGYSWYRVLVRVPSEWKDGPVRLFVEAVDDARSAWVNGQQVGINGTFPPRFRSGLGEKGRFDLPAGTLKPGQLNTVALRVYQNDPRPNFSVAPPVLIHTELMQGIRLEGQWQYRPGDDPAWASATAAEFSIDPTGMPSDTEAVAKGLYQRIDKVDDIEQFAARRNGDTDPLSPQDALKQFTTSDDLSVELVLSDPVIAQPLFMTWDDRGRLWLAEYRQYPDPAGLTMISRDT
ncbi:MAG: beta galactosidase jelly roll domain-containing protein, partial [Planctomycetaceae bacterium]|nr:beta galactosidase jelly roll domain-containing protein [Planctomycetaceae bacterium]